ncbi:MAG: Forkhead-associated protein [Myxococcales bacterium]|nr:Forkhead-associated protein [Myxococcales bacterium]
MGSAGTGGWNNTIGVDLWGGQARGEVQNRCTVMRSVTTAVFRDPRSLFLGAYNSFAEKCRQFDEPGVAIVAVHETSGRAQGLVRLRARVERHVAAIVGRHDAADLYLPAHDSIALRHLAIVLDPVTSWRAGNTNVRYRVLDLRTNEGFLDEQGRGLRGMRCEGPAVIRFAGHTLFMLPLGDASDWPSAAEDAWGFIPERVYFDEVNFAQGSMPRMPQMGSDARQSTIVRTHGPRDTGVNLVASGSIAGTLELEGPHRSGRIQIGHDELTDGVLLGRYERCASAAFADDPSLSRVHALLIQIDEHVMMIDTASTNGTRIAGQSSTRVIPLAQDTELELGKKTRARWRWLS